MVYVHMNLCLYFPNIFKWHRILLFLGILCLRKRPTVARWISNPLFRRLIRWKSNCSCKHKEERRSIINFWRCFWLVGRKWFRRCLLWVLEMEWWERDRWARHQGKWLLPPREGPSSNYLLIKKIWNMKKLMKLSKKITLKKKCPRKLLLLHLYLSFKLE